MRIIIFSFFVLLFVQAEGQVSYVKIIPVGKIPYTDSSIQEQKFESAHIFSPINEKNSEAKIDDFSFIVSGHFHGSSNGASGMPAASLMANLDNLNEMNPEMIFCLGDLFLNVERDHKNYEKFLFKKLKMPLFNAVGNHDVDNAYYEKNYGQTFMAFTIGSNGFIILDSERDNGDISGEQLVFLKRSLDNMNSFKNIFIFMHRTLWAEDDENLAELFPDNTQSTTSTNFQSEILPLIERASDESKVFLFSGSIGGMAPASFLYHEYNKSITFIATAIRDLPRDAILSVFVKNNEVRFVTTSLNSNKVLPLEKYSVEWWKKHKPEPPGFNWRLVPLYIWQMITHPYFWYGVMMVMSIILFIWVIKFLIRKRRAKKT